MKRYKYMFAAAFALVLAACTDDELVDNGIPVETGDEIMFGSTLDGDQNVNVVGQNRIETRTVYGDRTTTGIPVYWKADDQIAIFCPQASAPANHLVNYKVTPNTENPSASGTVVKVNPDDVGLQWGAANEHKFFGIYPASIVKATDTDDQGGTITASLPTLQQPVGWRRPQQITPEGENRTVYFAEPNMDYAFMVAYKKELKSEMTTSKAISLDFKNLVTVLDITIPGPETGTVTVTNVNVDVVQGQNVDICGDFTIQVDKLDENIIKCTPIPNDKVTDRISIPCYQADKSEFVTLGPNDVLNVKAFIIPDTQNPGSFRQFRITVASLNGSANRMTLNKAELGQSVEQAIVPHKINRILLPKVKRGEPVDWMANLDSNIYLTELSIPGSKFSYLTAENGAQPAYQTVSIADQFATGIRAFIVQTGADVTYDVTRKNVSTGWIPKYEDTYAFKTASSLSVDGAKQGTTLENTLDVISKGLQERTSECAFLILTCQGSKVTKKYNELGEGWGLFENPDDKINWDQAWIEAVQYQLNNLKNKYPVIYDTEITANTTLGDVRGKLIIKVNTNAPEQEDYISTDAEIPALFSIWENPKDHANDHPYPFTSTVPLYWGTPNSKTSRAAMNWMSAEVTHVGVEINKEQKEASITNMFKAAVDVYNNPANTHNTFFMVDAGGEYSSGTNPTGDIARDMNQLVVDALQTRTQNASTGLVFMNFADRGVKQSDGSYQGSGLDYKSDYIISSVIDNNFKFALRKKGGSTPAAR